MIQIIPTRYNGVLYRSRTEARWAVFLDTLGVNFDYEPETYNVNGIWYLPDFYVHEWNIFIEIKGNDPTPKEHYLCKELSSLSDKNIVLARGAPGTQLHYLYRNEENDVDACRFEKCKWCKNSVIARYQFSDLEEPNFVIALGNHNSNHCYDSIEGAGILQTPSQKARDERFGVYE